MLLNWQAQLPPSWIPRPDPDGNPFDLYPDLYVASLWNNLRGARILIHETLGTTAVLHQMSTDICRSVEYHLRGLPPRTGRTAQHVVPGGSELLIWPLFMAGKLPTTGAQRRGWIADQLGEIGMRLGNRLAVSLGEILREGDGIPFSRSELWDYG